MTKREKIKKLILIVFLLAVCFVLISVYKTQQKNPPPPNLPLIKGEAGGGQSVKTTLEIDGIKYETEITENETVYEFMEKLRNEGKIDFKEKTYVGMGKFIEEINGVKGNGNKYWIYYVNNKKAEVGVSNYKLKSGDVVSWKLESQY